jgi:hypothetical protein
MKRGSTILIQVVTALLGVGVLALLLWEPQVEGRNVNATQFEIYFKDPFLAYVYLAFAPFFVGLYQAFKILGYAPTKRNIFSAFCASFADHQVLRINNGDLYCGAEAYLFVFMRGKDDIAGGVMMGAFIILVSAIIATAAAVFQRILQNAVEIKSERTT